MSSWYVTFGIKYATEEHNRLPYWAVNPEGWLEVHAERDMDKLLLIEQYVGRAQGSAVIECAFIYGDTDWEPEHFPDGCSGWIDDEGLHRTKGDTW